MKLPFKLWNVTKVQHTSSRRDNDKKVLLGVSLLTCVCMYVCIYVCTCVWFNDSMIGKPTRQRLRCKYKVDSPKEKKKDSKERVSKYNHKCLDLVNRRKFHCLFFSMKLTKSDLIYIYKGLLTYSKNNNNKV